MQTANAIEFLARHLKVGAANIVLRATYYSVESPIGYKIKRLWSGLFECGGEFYSCCLEQPASYSKVNPDIARFRISQSKEIRENSAILLPCPKDDFWVSSEYIRKNDQEIINSYTPMQCCMNGAGMYFHPTNGIKEYNHGDVIVINIHQQEKGFDLSKIAYTKTL